MYGALLIAVVAVLAVAFSLVNKQPSTATGSLSSNSSLNARFTYLSQQHTNYCALPGFLAAQPDNGFLQGSCCSAMNFSSYAVQVNSLANYSGVPQIPKDPYNISVSLARELIGYDNNITLTSAQQSVYNQAVNISSEHGPCCCKCWRWFAFEGQAKYFLVHEMFNAKQIAHIWELEDGCGGPLSSSGFQPAAG